jgi:Zn-dependent protease with chaperone function
MKLLLAILLLSASRSVSAGETLYTQRWRNEARSGPGTYYGLKGTLNKAVAVTPLQAQGDWVQISLPPLTAWMAKTSLGPALPKDSILDSMQRLRSKFTTPTYNAAAVAAVRGFALRYGRAKASDLNALNALQPPFFTPEEYAAFKASEGGPRPSGKAYGGDFLPSYDPAMQEEGAGLGIAAKVASGGLVKDRALLRYVNMLGTLLAESSGAYGYPFKVYVTTSKQVNALSVPGGYIFLSRPLIAACQNEAELAAVLAHEMTHITRRHGLKELKARETNIRADAAMAELDEAAGEGPDPEAEADLTDFADTAYDTVHKPRLQSYEEEADRGAALILARAGYDPASVPRMIERVGAAVSKDAQNPFAKNDYAKRREAAAAVVKSEAGGGSGATNAPRFQKAVAAR